MPGEPFQIRSQRVGHRVVLSLAGEIDMVTAPQLSEAMRDVTGCLELWVDLSAVSFMDSTGLSALVRAERASRAAEHSLAIICPPGAVRRVLELSGVDGLLEVFTDRASANGHAPGT